MLFKFHNWNTSVWGFRFFPVQDCTHPAHLIYTFSRLFSGRRDCVAERFCRASFNFLKFILVDIVVKRTVFRKRNVPDWSDFRTLVAIWHFTLNLANGGSLNGPLTKPFFNNEAIVSVMSTSYSAVEVVLYTLQPGSEIFCMRGAPYQEKLKAFWAFANWCGNIFPFAFSIFSSKTFVFILVSIFFGKLFSGKLSQKLIGVPQLYELRMGTSGLALVLTDRTWVLLDSKITILFISLFIALSLFSGRRKFFLLAWTVKMNNSRIFH